MAVTLLLLAACKKDTLPSVTTKAVSNIAATTITCGGTIISDGGPAVTERGICKYFEFYHAGKMSLVAI
jgi:hypothetical protein